MRQSSSDGAGRFGRYVQGNAPGEWLTTSRAEWRHIACCGGRAAVTNPRLISAIAGGADSAVCVYANFGQVTRR